MSIACINILIILVKPQISLSKSEANILVSQPIEVICSSAGDPTPRVQWYKLKNGSNVIDKKIKTDFNNKLIFKPAQKDDQGTYICEARNVAGMVRAAFNLAVQGML